MRSQQIGDSETQLQRQKENLDLKKTLSMVLSHWYLFIIGLIIAGGSAWVINRYTVPVYQLKSSLLVKETNESSPFASSGAISEQAFQGFALPGGSSNLYNQLIVLRSRPIIEKTIQELDFEVSYFVKGDIIKSEVYTNAPFTVYWEKDHPQLVNLDYTVKLINDSLVQVVAKGENIRVHNYEAGINLNTLPNVNIEKTAKIG